MMIRLMRDFSRGSTQPNQTVWGWGSSSAAPSSRVIKDACWRPLTMALELRFHFRFHARRGLQSKVAIQSICSILLTPLDKSGHGRIVRRTREVNKMTNLSMHTPPSSDSGIRVENTGDLKADVISEVSRLRMMLAEMMIENQRLRNSLQTIGSGLEAL